MSIKTKIKAIFTIIFSSVLILAMSSCKTAEETDRSSSEPTASTTSITTTTTTLTTTTTTTTRKTTTTSKVTTITSTTTSAATTTTVPEQTTTQQTTTVATTVTTAAPVVTTTTTSTAAPVVVTTTAPAPVTNGTQTETWIENGEVVYITMVPYTINDPESSLHGTVLNIPCEVEEPLTPTEQAYFDLADKGILTDEIREIITEDVMNYAIGKYGCSYDISLYANSTTDYCGSFYGGARNDQHGQMSLELYASIYDWGDYTSVYDFGLIGNKKHAAQDFQEDIYSWTDHTFECLVSEGYSVEQWGCGVGFCYFHTEDNGYNVYQVSFLY